MKPQQVQTNVHLETITRLQASAHMDDNQTAFRAAGIHGSPNDLAYRLASLRDGFAISQADFHVCVRVLLGAIAEADPITKSVNAYDDDAVRHRHACAIKGSMVLSGQMRAYIVRSVESHVASFGARIPFETIDRQIQRLLDEKEIDSKIGNVEKGADSVLLKCVLLAVIPPALRFLHNVRKAPVERETTSTALKGALDVTDAGVGKVAARLSHLSRCFGAGYDADAKAEKVLREAIASNVDLEKTDFMILEVILLKPAIEVLEAELLTVLGSESEAVLFFNRLGLPKFARSVA